MEKGLAKRIWNALKKGERPSRLLRVERLKSNDPVWQHKWIVNKPNILGGVRLRRTSQPDGEQLNTLALVLMEWYPDTENYYLIVLDDRKLDTALAEIHKTEVVSGTTYLTWEYVPKKKGDGRNPKRKACFAEVYPDATVEISTLQAERDMSGFISEIFDLAQAKVDADQCVSPDISDDSSADEELLAFEGKQRRLYVLHRTRERKLRAKRIEAALRDNEGRLVCEVPGCNFDFNEVYGELGEGFAHVHHKKPLAQAGKGMHVSLDDLAIVCANCHAMIHRGGKCRQLEGLIKVSFR